MVIWELTWYGVCYQMYKNLWHNCLFSISSYHKTNVTFCSKSNEIIEDACTLDFWPPLNQLQSIIAQLNKLKDKHEYDYIFVINNKCLDVVELRNLLVLHDIQNTKFQVEEENE